MSESQENNGVYDDTVVLGPILKLTQPIDISYVNKCKPLLSRTDCYHT